MATYSWEKKESAGSWVPFDGTPTAEHPTEDFDEGTWDVRLSVTENGQTVQETKTAYVTVTGAASYTGPLDLVPGAIAAFSSARALSTNMLGQPGVQIQKLDGGAEPTQDFNYDASTGDIPSADIATFLGADDGQLNYLYGNSGNEEYLEGFDPALVWNPSVIGGKPGVSMEISSAFLGTELSFPNGAATVFVVGYRMELDSGSGPPHMKFLTGNPVPFSIDLFKDPNRAGGDGAFVAGVKLFEGAWQFGAKSFMINGESQSFDNSFDGGGAVGAFLQTLVVNAEDEDALLVEIIIYNTLLSAGDRLAIRQNIANFYGIALP